MSTKKPVSPHINVYNTTAPRYLANTTSKSVTGAVISISNVPARFSSAKRRIVMAGMTNNEGSQNMLNMISITVNWVGRWLKTDTMAQKITPMIIRNNISTTYPRTDAKYAPNSRRSNVGTFVIAAHSFGLHAVLPRP